MKKFLLAAFAALTLVCVSASAQTQAPVNTRMAGRFIASRYNWATGQVKSTNSVSAGAATMILTTPYVTLPDGSVLFPFTVPEQLMIDQGTSIAEIVSLTSASGCATNAPNGQCMITATFANAHGPSATITSATFGLQEALNDAAQAVAGAQQTLVIGANQVHGGVVVIDSTWPGTSVAAPQSGATVTPWPEVAIEDTHGAVPQWYSVQPSNATAVATPTTLVAAATCSASTTVCSGTAATLGGTSATWTSATKHFCVTYVDLMGNEGPCSLDASFTTTASVVVQVTAPAASAGVAGYNVYSGASFAAATRLPLVPGTTGGPTCVLTTIETVTPACAVSNATYGQAASNATFALVPATTQPQPPGTTTSSFTTLQSVDVTHTVYSYQQTNAVPPNFVTGDVSYAAVVGTTNSAWVMGRRHLPAGFLNTIGKTIRITGEITVPTNTVPNWNPLIIGLAPPWTASAPVSVCVFANTTAFTNVVWNISFSCTITTQTVGASGTVLANGFATAQYTTQGATVVQGSVNNIVAAATVNLTAADEIDVTLESTASTGLGAAQLTQLSVETLN